MQLNTKPKRQSFMTKVVINKKRKRRKLKQTTTEK